MPDTGTGWQTAAPRLFAISDFILLQGIVCILSYQLEAEQRTEQIVGIGAITGGLVGLPAAFGED